MALPELFIFFFIFEQRFKSLCSRSSRSVHFADLFQETAQSHWLAAVRHESGSHGHKIFSVFREDDLIRFEFQCFNEPLPELGHVCERPAQESHMAFYPVSAGQAAYSLVHYSLEN